MREIFLQGQNYSSQIIVGESLANVSKYLTGKKTIVITDRTVFQLYHHLLEPFPVIVLEPGEQTKTLQTIEMIVAKLLEKGIDRHSFLLGVGGGVVCDVTGFVATVFMRGIAFGFVSTSLLSQVDASIGGKNGVNFHSFKNIIGTFNHPQFILCDIEMLKTLPKEEIRSGWGEIIKHALIADETLFKRIEIAKEKDVFTIDKSFYEELIYRNIEIKTSIVRQDEKETGIRKQLNFGHTLGHAIEKISGRTHGESVMHGMLFASWWSAQKKMIANNEFQRIKKLLEKFKIAEKLPIDTSALMETVKKDKKRNGEAIDFVFLSGMGKAHVKSVAFSELSEAIENYWKY